MRYDVYWSQIAEQELLALWSDPARRDEARRAARIFDARLRLDAHTLGESRVEGSRILFEPPFGIMFNPVQSEGQVFVMHIWYYSKRSPSS